MNDRYRLSRLRNDDLITSLRALIQRGNALNADVLAHLAELDERRLHLEYGYPSLFAYCTKKLGLSQSAAGRRIAAARVCRNFPHVFARVARGELYLCALSTLAPHLTPENAEELLEACVRKSRRDVEIIVAARFPKPDVPDSIRRLPERTEATRALPSPLAPMPTLAEPVTPTPRGEASPVALTQPPRPAVLHPAPRTIEPLSIDRFSVRFTADTEFLELLEKAADLGSHGGPRPDLMTVLRRSLEAYVRELEKKRFGIGKKSRVQLRARMALKPSRYISAATMREVYARDEGRCTYVSPDGKRCNSCFHLEIDHVQPFADNGPPTAANLRLLCRAHNQEYARRYFGKSYVRAAIARARAARHESAAVRPLEKHHEQQAGWG